MDFHWFSVHSPIILNFSRFAGLKDIRMVPNRPGIAFVEFDTDSQAIPARTTLNNFRISAEHVMRVDYAKK